MLVYFCALHFRYVFSNKGCILDSATTNSNFSYSVYRIVFCRKKNRETTAGQKKKYIVYTSQEYKCTKVRLGLLGQDWAVLRFTYCIQFQYLLIVLCFDIKKNSGNYLPLDKKKV